MADYEAEQDPREMPGQADYWKRGYQDTFEKLERAEAARDRYDLHDREALRLPAFERRRARVYIAGPISKGDTWENIITGIRWGRWMLRDGLAPYVPHLDAFLTLDPGTPPTDEPSAWNALLEWDLEWVSVSDAVFRIHGDSVGADLEVDIAKRLGIPIFYDTGGATTDYPALLDWARREGLAGRRTYDG